MTGDEDDFDPALHVEALGDDDDDDACPASRESLAEAGLPRTGRDTVCAFTLLGDNGVL